MGEPGGLDLAAMLRDAQEWDRTGRAFALASHVRTLVAAVRVYRGALERIARYEETDTLRIVHVNEIAKALWEADQAVVAAQKG